MGIRGLRTMALAVSVVLTSLTMIVSPQVSSASAIKSARLPGTSQVQASVYNYPATRFGPGRPSPVKGLKILSANGTKKTLTLTWDANPANEHVDSYALYYRSNLYLGPGGGDAFAGVLAAVTSATSITTQLVGESKLNSPYCPYGVNILPISLDGSGCGSNSMLDVWVIAHNAAGWGDNYFAAANPDENPANFSPLSWNQNARLGRITELTIDLTQLGPKFQLSPWPHYETTADYNSLSNTPPKSAWVVPWRSETDMPLSRFQNGRPTAVSNVKLVKFNPSGKTFHLSWMPSPTAEKVDAYAIYGLKNESCPSDFCQPFLLKVQKTTDFIPARFSVSTAPMDFGTLDYEGGALTLAAHSRYGFYVIAHNNFGWGNNDFRALNPDQATFDFRFPSTNQRAKFGSAVKNELDITIP